MRERARNRAIGLRTRCARLSTRGRYSTCDCRTSSVEVRAKLRAAGCGGFARWSRFRPTTHARVARSMALFHARPRAKHCATLKGGAAVQCAGRGPCAARRRTMAHDGARLRRTCRGRMRSLAPCDFDGGALRRPAAAPAMLRRCRDGWSDFF
ncbi:hypothetical protein F511_27414 [Dorcoceras hygrometricum]|uniref:Uncharacterized protein n=1 Tax=Dorcoceras hygrometricum TaxID=472368 RepID=A0A2Z7AH67_9LAMI|nr:hypothetical protein F511_27414 [Dorcoceras hygrometricum]